MVAGRWRTHNLRLPGSAATDRVLQHAPRIILRPGGMPHNLWQAEPSSAAQTVARVFHAFAAHVRPPPGFNRAWVATPPSGVDSEDRGQHEERRWDSIDAHDNTMTPSDYRRRCTSPHGLQRLPVLTLLHFAMAGGTTTTHVDDDLHRQPASAATIHYAPLLQALQAMQNQRLPTSQHSTKST